MANDLSFNQISAVLNEIVHQATGAKAPAPVNTSEFVAVGQLALKSGYDNLTKAISQIVTRTIFANRPYTRMFKGLEVSQQQFEAGFRKISISDKDWMDDSRYNLVDGQSVDQQIVSIPEITQLNFYGGQPYERYYTVTKDQLDSAFTGPDQLNSFLSLLVTNTADIIEQCHEEMARECLVNMVGGVSLGGSEYQKIKLLTEYNSLTGQNLTADKVFSPENFRDFVQFMVARVNDIKNLLRQRSVIYHTNLTGRKPIPRHTPYDRQRTFIQSRFIEQMKAMSLSNTFNADLNGMDYTEALAFWQNIQEPTKIDATVTYLNADGTLTEESPVQMSNLIGVIADADALGYTVVNQWSSPSPFNSRGGYQNTWFHFTDRYWNDFTENCVILLLE